MSPATRHAFLVAIATSAVALSASSPNAAPAAPVSPAGDRAAPRSLAQLLVVQRMDVAELALVGRSFDAPEILHFAEPIEVASPGLMVLGVATAEDGTSFRLGAGLAEGTALGSGLLVNASADSALLIVAGGRAVEVIPNALVVVGSFYVQPVADGQSLLAGGCCGITCGSGFYACCNAAQGALPCTCKCVRNTINAPCQSGGQGANGCSVGP